MIRAIAFAAGLVSAAGAPVWADGPVVIELFTSQGCANCPPADALLSELAGRDDVLALALHVDYWDYIGWTDTFGDPAHTARQQAYAAVAGSNVVYTPQMVIGGQDRIAGHRPMAVFDTIMAHDAVADPVSIEITAEAGAVLVDASWAGPLPDGPLLVQLVTYLPHERVAIGRGENANHTFDYHNIVTSWQVIAEWDGAAPYQVRITPESDDRHALIVQAAGPGPILGAARLD